MNEEHRVNGLLEIARQHMQRFHELEEIEFKMSFSVWALLGGLAYFWVIGKDMVLPEPLKGRPAFGWIALPVIIHGLVLFMFNREEERIAKLRNRYRDEAAKILGITPPACKPRLVVGIRWHDWGWIAWNLVATAAMAAAVLYLMQLRSK